MRTFSKHSCFENVFYFIAMHQHFILHKPFGVISQFINNKTRKKKVLGELYDFPEGTMSVGRLDVKSEGLLLLTTDGKMSHFICSSKVEKEYYVQVDGEITDEALNELKKGVEIGIDGGKYTTKPGLATRLLKTPNFLDRTKKIRDDRHGKTSWVSIVINEGKFRQVRKMTSAVGFPTLRLVRVRVGEIKLGDLEAGNIIEVDELRVL